MIRGERPLRLLGLLLVGLTAVLTTLGVPVTSAQGATVHVVRSDVPLPVNDPWAAAWDAVRPIEVTLSGQAVAPPRLLIPSVATVRARAMVDDERFAMLLEWADPTSDEDVLDVGRFADQAAMQFALGSGTSVCMGQQAGALNIWHWKADWAADLAARKDIEQRFPNAPQDEHVPPGLAEGAGLGPGGFLTGRAAGNPRSALTHPSAVEDLIAAGFGTLTPEPFDRQDVAGASSYRDGTWRVVMSRRLDNGDPNDAALEAGRSLVVAFAVWDGARGDRNGLKSVSAWLSLVIPAREMSLLDHLPFLVLILVVLALGAWLFWIGGRQPAIGLGGPPA
jgi:hypothetical protein